MSDLHDPIPKMGVGSATWAQALIRWLENLIRQRIGRIEEMIIRREGAPPVSLQSPVGTLYLRLDGGAGTTLYVREPGGWVGK